jgi:hypothetical protein
MEPQARAITWEAPEHYYQEKKPDWYLVLGIIVIAVSVAAIMLGNVLFALLIVVSGITLSVAAAKKPSVIPFSISVRGIKIDEDLYPYTTLKAYCIDEEDVRGPQLIIQTKKRFTPLIVIPIPTQYVDDVEDLIRNRLTEKHLEEPLFMKMLERIGL